MKFQYISAKCVDVLCDENPANLVTLLAVDEAVELFPVCCVVVRSSPAGVEAVVAVTGQAALTVVDIVNVVTADVDIGSVLGDMAEGKFLFVAAKVKILTELKLNIFRDVQKYTETIKLHTCVS